MGVAVAQELAARGATVDLVLGPSSLRVDLRGVQVERVESAQQMYEACIKKFPASDIAVMAAAGADYTPAEVFAEKLKKESTSLTLELVRTKDILHSLGR